MRGLLRVGLLVLVLAAVALAGRAWSEPRPAPRPKTHVGLVNLAHTLRSYEKFKAYQVELKGAIRPFQEKELELKKRVDELLREAREGEVSAEKREKLEEALKGLQRAHENLKKDFQKAMGKKQEEQLVALYKDIDAAVRTHAKAHDLELVMHYSDGHTDAERWAPANVTRKIQAGAAMPLYVAPGIDITEAVIRDLNENYKKRKGG
jgi:Skp family chaperone for outer membrane proteins